MQPTQPPTDIELEIPTDNPPAAECPYCGYPFSSERLCALHLGEAHQDEWTDDEREAYEDAYDTESDELFIFHLKVIALLVFVFFSFTYTYAFVFA